MKHIIALLLVLLAVTLVVVPVGAEEITEVTGAVTTTEAPVTEAPPVTEALPGESPVKDVSDYLKEWVPEILSAAALALSAVITYLFKKGLLPGVKKALTAIDSTVTGYNDRIEKFVDRVSGELELSKETSAELLAKYTLQEKHVKDVLLIVEKALITQSDALCDLLENTNLPAQTKAEIAAKHKAQVEEIAGLINAE